MTVHVLDDGGNVMDGCSIACIASLLHFRKPNLVVADDCLFSFSFFFLFLFASSFWTFVFGIYSSILFPLFCIIFSFSLLSSSLFSQLSNKAVISEGLSP